MLSLFQFKEIIRRDKSFPKRLPKNWVAQVDRRELIQEVLILQSILKRSRSTQGWARLSFLTDQYWTDKELAVLKKVFKDET